MSKFIRNVVDMESYKKAKSRSGLSTVEQIAQSTGLATPIVRALDEHGIILTEDSMLLIAQAFHCSVHDLVKRIEI